MLIAAAVGAASTPDISACLGLRWLLLHFASLTGRAQDRRVNTSRSISTAVLRFVDVVLYHANSIATAPYSYARRAPGSDPPDCPASGWTVDEGLANSRPSRGRHSFHGEAHQLGRTRGHTRLLPLCHRSNVQQGIIHQSVCTPFHKDSIGIYAVAVLLLCDAIM